MVNSKQSLLNLLFSQMLETLKIHRPLGVRCVRVLVYLPPIVPPPRRAENGSYLGVSGVNPGFMWGFPPPPWQGSGATGGRLEPGFGPPIRSWALLEAFLLVCSASWCSCCGSGANFCVVLDALSSIFGLSRGRWNGGATKLN